MEYPKYYNYDYEKGEYYEVVQPFHDHYHFVYEENAWYEDIFPEDKGETIMGDEEVVEKECPYLSWRKDCDGDWNKYCCGYGIQCGYKRRVRDCDGDIIEMCSR